MAFTNNIKNIENIKNNYQGSYKRQEMLMEEYIEKMSKVAVDSDIINRTFASLVSYYLSKSDFKMFNMVLLDNEVQFISDAIGCGDIISFHYDDKKQINTINYQNSDKLISVTLKVNNNKAYVTRVINSGDNVIKTKSTFKKNGESYYQDSFTNKLISSDEEFTTYVKEKYCYDVEKDELEKEFSIVTKENEKIISKSSIRTTIDKSDYIVEDGKFYTINKKNEHIKMKKCKKLENKLVNLFN